MAVRPLALVTIPLSAALLLSACGKGVSGTDAVSAVASAETVQLPASQARLRHVWAMMQSAGPSLDHAGLSATVTGQLDGEAAAFRAIVIETVLTGKPGNDAPCRANRRTLLAWTEGAAAEGLVLTSARESDSLAAPGACWRSGGPPVGVIPTTLEVFPLQDGGQQVWDAVRGSATLNPMGSRSGCPSPLDRELAHLGIRCQQAAFNVSVDADLARPVSRQDPWVNLDETPFVYGAASRSIRLAPSRVPGFRWTINCDGSAGVAPFCGAAEEVQQASRN